MSNRSERSRRFVPLADRLGFFVTLVVLTFGTLNLLIVGSMAYRAQTREQDRRIHFIANLIAQRAEQPILFDDLVSLDQLVRQSTQIDDDIAYIMILSPRGTTIVHTFPDEVPEWARRRVHRPAHIAAAIRHSDDGEVYREIEEPVFGGDFGSVVVGMSQRKINSQIATMISMIALFVAFLLALGLAAARIVARRVTAPIARIADGIESFRLDGEALELGVDSADEIGMIADRIEAMARRLQEIYHTERERERDLMRIERLAALGTLAAGIAHEVNNPLAGIKNAAQRLTHAKGDSGRIESYAGLISGAVDRTQQIVERMLDLASTKPRRIEPVSLYTALEEAIELAQPRLATGHVRVDVDVDDELPPVRADPAHVTQILLNLLLNAADAIGGREGGRVTVRSQDGAADQVAVEIEDNGEGVSTEIAERIFDPFFTTKGARHGTGLGLSVSWSMASEMGGKLELVNPGQRGAIFRLTLPTEEANPCPPAS